MTHVPRGPLRTAVIAAVGTLLGGIALALHPHAAGHADARREIRELVALGPRDELVHGTLLLLLGALLASSVRYGRDRGLSRGPVLTAVVSLAIGVAGLLAAVLVDGFVLPRYAMRLANASAAERDAGLATAAAGSVAVDVFTAFGMTASAIAIGACSLDLVRDRGGSRVAGLAGFVVAASSVALVAHDPALAPHTVLAVFGAQSIWFAGIALLRARET